MKETYLQIMYWVISHGLVLLGFCLIIIAILNYKIAYHKRELITTLGIDDFCKLDNWRVADKYNPISILLGYQPMVLIANHKDSYVTKNQRDLILDKRTVTIWEVDNRLGHIEEPNLINYTPNETKLFYLHNNRIWYIANGAVDFNPRCVNFGNAHPAQDQDYKFKTEPVMFYGWFKTFFIRKAIKGEILERKQTAPHAPEEE